MSPFKGHNQLENRVREYREKAGLTQEGLAAKVNLSRQSIIAIEKGRFTPSILTALNIADALQVTVEDLFQLKQEDHHEN